MNTRKHVLDVCAELEAAALRGNYDRANKHAFHTMLSEMERLFLRPERFQPQYATEIRRVREAWQKDRMNAAGGADTIQALIARVRKLAVFMPPELPAPNNYQDLSHLAKFSEPVLQAAAMRK